MPTESYSQQDIIQIWENLPERELEHLQIAANTTASMLKRAGTGVVYLADPQARILALALPNLDQLVMFTGENLPEDFTGTDSPRLSIIESVSGKKELSALTLPDVANKAALIGLRESEKPIVLSKQSEVYLLNQAGYASNVIEAPGFLFTHPALHSELAIEQVLPDLIKKYRS